MTALTRGNLRSLERRYEVRVLLSNGHYDARHTLYALDADEALAKIRQLYVETPEVELVVFG